MSEKQNGLSQELRDIWTDAYKYHATFESMGNSDEDWDRAADAMKQLAERRGNHPFAVWLLLSVYEYLEQVRMASARAEAERRAVND